MAANEHKNLLDANRHYPMGYESAENNMVVSKTNGMSYDDRNGNYSWNYPLQTFELRLDGSLSTASGIDYIRMPYDFILREVRASVFTAGTLVTVDIQESAVSILSTLLTIDAGEKTSTTAATPVVISDYELANDSEVLVNLTVGEGEVPTDLKVYLIGYRKLS
tara:strand:- start:1223 stop:1714 length:492 start_codon:yes stop_codon:yes gene_type:complete